MSKIRLHGSSSGYMEIAPPAAGSSETITLPNSAGEVLLSDGSAASLTQIPAANIVGVCTSGLTKTGGFGKVLKVQQTTIPGLATYSTGSTTYQEITNDPFVVVGTNSNLLIMLNIMGYNSSSAVDRNFRLAYKVASGSYTNINFNPNGTVSENMFSDIRGSGPSYELAVNTQFLIDGTWNAGDTITIKLETVGESTFYFNTNIASADVRFGNGLSKFIFTEYSD